MKIIFLGSQGSGKSTQARLAAQKLNLPYIEMGQLFRDKAKDNDREGIEVKQVLQVGELVPDSLAIKIFKERTARPDCKNGYVLDGYPRNYAQLEVLDPDIDRVFFIKVSDQEGIKRSISRARGDDTFAVLTKRLDIYHKSTERLIHYFSQKGVLEEVDGERTIEAIAKDISQRLDNVLRHSST